MFTIVHQCFDIIKIRSKRVVRYFPLTIGVHARILAKSLDKWLGMARKVRDKDLGDRASRAKLKPSGKPYWRILDQGLHLGYRKNKSSGKWVVRLYRKGAKQPYVTDTLPGVADDKADPDNDAVLSFFQAQVKGASGSPSSKRKSCGLPHAAPSARRSINMRRICGCAAATPGTLRGSAIISPMRSPRRASN